MMRMWMMRWMRGLQVVQQVIHVDRDGSQCKVECQGEAAVAKVCERENMQKAGADASQWWRDRESIGGSRRVS